MTARIIRAHLGPQDPLPPAPANVATVDLISGRRTLAFGLGRSFQLACDRVRAKPEIAGALIHKPGPLSDCPDDLEQLAAVYRRGMAEVEGLLAGVTAGPA